MPGPALYVVVVVGAFATSYVLKKFVYDPWAEQRRARSPSQHRFQSPVLAPSGHRSPTRSRGTPPIELDTMVASDVDEWRTSANMRRRTNNMLDDRIPNEVEYPVFSPGTPLARSPPYFPGPAPNQTTPIHLPQSLSSPDSLRIHNLSSFAADVDYTASSVDVTPLAQAALLQSEPSPQLTAMSPFTDVFELARSQISEAEVVRTGSESDDDVFSVPSSVSSVTATDDEDDNNSFGSGESWHDLRNELHRS